MSMNREGRPTRPENDLVANSNNSANSTNKAGACLLPSEPLLFEIGHESRSGVDFEPVAPFEESLGGLKRSEPIGCPALSEPEATRHFTRLSRLNYGIDMGLFPLGSCTMKHNPRLNEKMARLPGFGDLHPLQPIATVQGALLVMKQLSDWLKELTGMPEVSLSPKAGAHGELCGVMAIRAALEARPRRQPPCQRSGSH